ncbi:MAG TPA: hypothetical protein VJZ27_01450, partial [Aggregatilineales bacterium]|nr:hypothetical protein [Aggregatilineales bacterium]
DMIAVSGSNFPGNVKVNLYLEKQSLNLRSVTVGSADTRVDGTFSTTIIVPETWANGSPVNQNTASVSAYAPGGYWAMNFFVNLARQ